MNVIGTAPQPVVFDTVAQANAANLPTSVNSITINAWDAAALNLTYGVQQAQYQRVTNTGQPLIGGQVTTNNGTVFWQISGGIYWLTQFGSSSDTYSTALLNAQMFFNAQASTAAAASTIFTGGGSPVINWTGHNVAIGQSVYFTSTLTLPAAITANTLYFVISTTANSFQISATRLDLGGTAINMATSGTGTVTIVQAGLGAGGELIVPPTTIRFPSTIYLPIGVSRFTGTPWLTFLKPRTGAVYDQNFMLMYNMLAGGTSWQVAFPSVSAGLIGYFQLTNDLGINVSFLLYGGAPRVERINALLFIQVVSGIVNQYSDNQTIRDINNSQQPVLPSSWTTQQQCTVSVGGLSAGGDAPLIENIQTTASGVGPSGGTGQGIYLANSFGAKISRIINGNIYINTAGSVTIENSHFEQGSIIIQNADVKIRDTVMWNNAFNYTCTTSNASPGVVTITSSTVSLQNGVTGYFSATTGALPALITLGTVYYVVNYTGQTFQLATTPGGTAINFTGSSGNQTFTTIYIPIQIPNAGALYVSGYSSTVQVENCSFRSQAGASYTPPLVTSGAFANLPWPDIWVTEGNVLQIRDCYRQWIQTGSNTSAKSNSLMGIIVAGGTNAAPSLLTAFNSISGIAPADSIIDWDQTVNVTKTTKLPAVPNSFTLINGNDNLNVWPLATGAYTYAYNIYADTTRQLGSTCATTVSTSTLSGNPTLNSNAVLPQMAPFRSAGTLLDHCIYRFYRTAAGGAAGSYVSFVDIPAIHVGFPIDYGNHMDGFPWQTRTSGPVDVVAVAGFIGMAKFEGINVKATFYASASLAAPGTGTWAIGDQIDWTTPVADSTWWVNGVRCGATGTPGTWTKISQPQIT